MEGLDLSRLAAEAMHHLVPVSLMQWLPIFVPGKVRHGSTSRLGDFAMLAPQLKGVYLHCYIIVQLLHGLCTSKQTS